MTQGMGRVDRDHLESFHYRIRDLERRVGHVVQAGRVVEVNYETRRAKVEFVDGGRKSGWIPWTMGQNDQGAKDWTPLDVDSQVLVLSMGGDPATGAILAAGINYKDDEKGRDYRPWVAPDDEGSEETRKNTWGRRYRDGTEETHNTLTKVRNLKMPAGGTYKIEQGSNSIVMNDTSITFTVGGSSVKVEAGEITVTTAKFTGVQA